MIFWIQPTRVSGIIRVRERASQRDTGCLVHKQANSNHCGKFSGKITTVGSLTRITGNITLAGGDSSLTVFYCNGSLTIDSGVTVTVTKNVLIKVKGFFQVNGKIDGKGKGRCRSDYQCGSGGEVPGNTQSGWG